MVILYYYATLRYKREIYIFSKRSAYVYKLGYSTGAYREYTELADRLQEAYREYTGESKNIYTQN